MSIYQPKRSRAPMIALAIGMLVLGIAAGWLIWGAPAPDPLAALEPTREALASAADKIDVVVAHAEFAQEAGEESPAYAGSVDAIEQARASLGSTRAVLDELAPGTVEEIEAGMDTLQEQIESGAAPDSVIASATLVAEQLRAALGS